MNLRFKSPVLGFFVLYVILIVSLIFFALSYQGNKSESITEVKEKKSEVSTTFQKELDSYEEKKLEKEKEREGKWRPSKRFMIIAISAASVLDVVIIILWARHENKKRENKPSTKKTWTDKKWFWNIVAFGIVQPKNNRIVMNWKNFIIFIICMYLLKTILFKNI
ncbi:hypothetical protein ACFSO7_12015 [Bacillus sp. CGMCC 1.16607]|uniref:hypothetical protein n=1 Tax=Bacillus sp. CGMCC 1.16607 TaxID=3351842 RepID=UPI003626FD46